ncbi:hypothetical protein AAAC51_39145 [Priestia megaterium]
MNLKHPCCKVLKKAKNRNRLYQWSNCPMGRESNVATPVNKALVANVKGIETWVEKYINS